MSDGVQVKDTGQVIRQIQNNVLIYGRHGRTKLPDLIFLSDVILL